MRLHEPLRLERLDPQSRLAAANPLATLGAAAALMLALFLALDAVTAALVLLSIGVAAWLLRVPVVSTLGRAWPVLAGALVIGLFNALFAAQPEGDTLFQTGPIHLTTGSAALGLGVALRLLAIVIAGLLAVAAVDPTALADALVQQLHVSPRFAVGALAAFRLLPIFGREWQIMGLARRARGVESGGSPVARLREFAGRSHALLVAAIRRGSRLALAMDARGFGSLPCRTSARPQRMCGSDWVLLAGACAAATAASALSAALGTYRFITG